MSSAAGRITGQHGNNTDLVVWLHYGIVATLIALGAYLRFSKLGYQSLWFDEADIVVRAQRSWSEIFSTFTVAGENGPLYNVMLAVWIRVAGVSEFAVRFPSAVAGILALPAIYILGRRLAGPQTGLIATGLLAISPYHIWYSQEAKMYSIVALLAILSTLLLVEALDSGNSRLWIAYVVVTSAMFYTHVASVLIFGSQALFVAITIRNWKWQLRTILIAGAALTLPYLPIALWASRVIGGEVSTWHGSISLIDAFKTVGTRFPTFRSTDEIEMRAGWSYFLVALGSAIWLFASRSRRTVGWLLVLMTLIPIIGIWLVSLQNSVFSDRYIIGALPPYLILTAVGLAYLGRQRLGIVIAILLTTVLVVYTWYPMTEVNRSTIAQKEDWRGAYTLVADRARPDDVFIIYPGYMISIYEYYAQRDDRLEEHPIATIPLFGPEWMTREVMIDMLRQDFGAFTRFWLIESPDRVIFEDPNDELETWLNEAGQVLVQEQTNGTRVTLYALPEGW